MVLDKEGLLYEILRGELYSTFEASYDHISRSNLIKVNDDLSDTLMCSIHDIFDPLVKESKLSHNCIGCNLNDDISILINFLRRVINLKGYYEDLNIVELYYHYITFMYFASEKICRYFDDGSGKTKEKYKKLQSFNRVRHWMNFFKHPKHFVETHHPEYIFSGFSEADSLKIKYDLLINDEFVGEYYKGNTHSKNQCLNEKLKNKSVIIEFPNPLSLAEDFVREEKKFIEHIKSDKAFREKLHEITSR